METLSHSQRAHLKTICEVEIEGITKLQTEIDVNLCLLIQMAVESGGTDDDHQKQLDDWTNNLLLVIEESAERASDCILEATAKASPLLLEEGAAGGVCKQK